MTTFFSTLRLWQELSKIAMPVVFNEPLSFLQRLSEYMEHTHLIHQANTMTDSIERMKVPHHLHSSRNVFSLMKPITWCVLIRNQLSSVLQLLLCQQLLHSGRELGNHSTHYWERLLSSSGQETTVSHLHTAWLQTGFGLIFICLLWIYHMSHPAEKTWASGGCQSKLAITPQSVPFKLRVSRRILCSTAPFTPNSSFGGRA